MIDMTMAELLLSFDEKRNRAEREAERRRSALLTEKPKAARLLEEKNDILLGILKSRLVSGEGESEAQKRLSAINAKIAGECGREWEKSLIPAYDCPDCGDTGYISKKGRKEMCSCLLKRVFSEIYGGMPVESLEGAFERYDERVFPEGAQRAYMKAVRPLIESELNKGEKSTYFIQGESGLGKSFLMQCMARREYAKTPSVLYIDAFSLFGVFHRSRLGADIPIEPVFQADALFIDDLGTEPMTQNVTREYLFKLLSERQAAGRLTCIASNLSRDQLKSRYTEKVISRLLSQKESVALKFEGGDIRLSAGKNQH